MLTLADKHVLADDAEDVLVNVNLLDDERYKKVTSLHFTFDAIEPPPKSIFDSFSSILSSILLKARARWDLRKCFVPFR